MNREWGQAVNREPAADSSLEGLTPKRCRSCKLRGQTRLGQTPVHGSRPDPNLGRQARQEGLRLRKLAAPQAPVEIERFADDAHRVADAEQILDDDLLVFERLVVLEESPELQQQVRG